MKKLLSKKNGFTLVEILVAFVIFALMAGMVMSVVQLSIAARKSNDEFAGELAKQQEDLVRKGKTYKYDSANTALPTGTMNFTFVLPDGSAGGTAAIDYQAHATDDTRYAANLYEGLNYFIGDVNYEDDPIEDDSDSPGGAAQSDRYDTRITGTKGLQYIKVSKAFKDDTYSGTGVRYLFETTVLPEKVDSICMKFLQYKLFMKDTTKFTTKTTTKEDGKEYTYEQPVSATILSAGYVNSTTLDPTKCSVTRDNSTNPCMLTVLRNGGIQLGYDYSVESASSRTMDGGRTSRFYIIFEEDPHLSVSDFGGNGTGSITAYQYKNFTDADGTFQPNIYGANDYVYTPA